MIDPLLQSPDLQLAGDSNQVLNYKRDPLNYITQLFGEQLPAIKNGFFNVHMTKDKVVQPHWHTNATEMVIILSGEALTSVFNPFTHKLMTYHLKPGQVSILPKGWFHWIVAQTDHVHLLTIFDQPTPDIVYGADFLTSLPKEIAELAFCMNGEEYAKAVSPIHGDAILAPPPGCHKGYRDYEAAYGHDTGADLMAETLQNVEPSVQDGLAEARTHSAEHTLRAAVSAAYLIGKGYHPSTARQIVDSWRKPQ